MRSLLAAVVGADFASWSAEHGKAYATMAARAKAAATYLQNSKVIAELNADPLDGAEYAHTAWSDLTAEEFREQVLMQPLSPEADRAMPRATAAGPAPDAFDWADHGALSPIKNQANCGSCWAVSAVENLESMAFITGATKEVTPLSVEEIIECDPHGDACYGGYPSAALQYVKEAGGLSTQDTYPYDVDGRTICLANQTFNATCGEGICDDPPLTAYCDLTCSTKGKPRSPGSTITGYTALPTDEEQLAAWIAENGPPSVALDASGTGYISVLFPWLQFYKKGVAAPKKCSTTRLDHAVQLVGFGSDAGKPYWKVKNSWGAAWGEAGFFRMERGTGKCGINTIAVSANVQKVDVVV